MNNVVNQTLASVALLGAMAIVAGCNKEQTFADYYTDHQTEIGNKDPQLVDATTANGYTVALGSTAKGADARRFGVNVFEVTDNGWNQVTGLSCERGPSTSGVKDMMVLCGTLTESHANVARVLVDGNEVKLFAEGSDRIWYAISGRDGTNVRYLNNEGGIVKQFNLGG